MSKFSGWMNKTTLEEKKKYLLLLNNMSTKITNWEKKNNVSLNMESYPQVLSKIITALLWNLIYFNLLLQET